MSRGHVHFARIDPPLPYAAEQMIGSNGDVRIALVGGDPCGTALSLRARLAHYEQVLELAGRALLGIHAKSNSFNLIGRVDPAHRETFTLFVGDKKRGTPAQMGNEAAFSETALMWVADAPGTVYVFLPHEQREFDQFMGRMDRADQEIASINEGARARSGLAADAKPALNDSERTTVSRLQKEQGRARSEMMGWLTEIKLRGGLRSVQRTLFERALSGHKDTMAERHQVETLARSLVA